jgi:hypothetical protein
MMDDNYFFNVFIRCFTYYGGLESSNCCPWRSWWYWTCQLMRLDVPWPTIHLILCYGGKGWQFNPNMMDIDLTRIIGFFNSYLIQWVIDRIWILSNPTWLNTNLTQYICVCVCRTFIIFWIQYNIYISQ